ncbi:PIN domain-containing protein, partial [Pseudonocardia sp.]|uniref:PIN domain-containing protein n=2 Tax=Pseudonocardia sp. TaxID=60912 RepID=UPI003D0DA70D
MLLVLDTTALISDPYCRSASWQILIPAKSTWNVRMMIPEVVVIEAVRGFERKVAEASTAVARWSDKHRYAIGDTPAAAATIELTKMRDGYETDFAAILAEADVEIVAPPAAGHLEIVQRAATRRRPCDNNGDGYRDTLNWLTVLEILKRNEDEEIVWVSNNSRDFGDESDDSSLHSHLIEDLDLIGARARLTWCRGLPDAVALLASKNAVADPDDRLRLKSTVRDEAIVEILRDSLVPNLIGRTVQARDCGLPLMASRARIISVSHSSDLAIDVLGGAAGGDAALEVRVVIDVSTSFRLPLSADPYADEFRILSTDEDGHIAALTKPLLCRALLRLGKFGQPLSGEWAEVRALEDDPGLAAWRAGQAAMKPSGSTPQPPGDPLIGGKTLDAIRRMQETGGLSPGVFDAVRRMQETGGINPGVFDAVRRMQETGGINPGVFDAVRRMQETGGINPGVFDAVR